MDALHDIPLVHYFAISQIHIKYIHLQTTIHVEHISLDKANDSTKRMCCRTAICKSHLIPPTYRMILGFPFNVMVNFPRYTALPQVLHTIGR